MFGGSLEARTPDPLIKRHSLKHSHVYSISRKRMIHKAFSRFSLLYLFVTSLKCLTELSPNCPHNNGESLSNKTDHYSSQQINDILAIISSRCIWHYKTCIPFSPQSSILVMINNQIPLEAHIQYLHLEHMAYTHDHRFLE